MVKVPTDEAAVFSTELPHELQPAAQPQPDWTNSRPSNQSWVNHTLTEIPHISDNLSPNSKMKGFSFHFASAFVAVIFSQLMESSSAWKDDTGLHGVHTSHDIRRHRTMSHNIVRCSCNWTHWFNDAVHIPHDVVHCRNNTDAEIELGSCQKWSTRRFVITGTPTKSEISLLLGHICGYNLARLSPR